MKMNGKQELLAQIARRGLLLLSFVVVTVFGAGYSSAQTKTPAASASKADNAKTASAQAQADSMQPAPVAEAKAAPRGGQEGIKVHGHWMIEVKNPNGTVDRRVEFENGLCVMGSGNYPIGDAFIANLLLGNAVPGGWVVEFGDAAIPNASPLPLPCGGGPAGGDLPQTVFSLPQSQAWLSGAYCQLSSLVCFPGLSVQLYQAPNSGPFGLQLSGQFTVPSYVPSLQITAVGTAITFCPPESPSSCLSSPQGLYQITGQYLSGTGSVPGPVAVGPNQLVSVTVQITFH